MKWKKVRIAVLNYKYNNIIKNFNSINMVCKYLIYKLVNRLLYKNILYAVKFFKKFKFNTIKYLILIKNILK